MWDLFALIDFNKARERLEQNLGSNAKQDSKRGWMFIALLGLLGFGVFQFSVYRCYRIINNWELCRLYSVDQIEDAQKKGKKLATRYGTEQVPIKKREEK